MWTCFIPLRGSGEGPGVWRRWSFTPVQRCYYGSWEPECAGTKQSRQWWRTGGQLSVPHRNMGNHYSISERLPHQLSAMARQPRTLWVIHYISYTESVKICHWHLLILIYCKWSLYWCPLSCCSVWHNRHVCPFYLTTFLTNLSLC